MTAPIYNALFKKHQFIIPELAFICSFFSGMANSIKRRVNFLPHQFGENILVGQIAAKDFDLL